MIALFTLLAIVIYIGIAWAVIKHRKTKKGKYIAIAILALIPMGDEVVGRITHSYLCSAEAGVKVYETAELPADYWDKDGRARFLKPNGDLDKPVLQNRFDEPAVKKTYSYVFGIDEYRQQVVDNSTRKTLGEVINFMYWGGWVSRNLSPHPSAVDCKELHGNMFWNNFYSSLFKRPNTAK